MEILNLIQKSQQSLGNLLEDSKLDVLLSRLLEEIVSLLQCHVFGFDVVYCDDGVAEFKSGNIGAASLFHLLIERLKTKLSSFFSPPFLLEAVVGKFSRARHFVLVATQSGLSSLAMLFCGTELHSSFKLYFFPKSKQFTTKPSLARSTMKIRLNCEKDFQLAKYLFPFFTELFCSEARESSKNFLCAFYFAVKAVFPQRALIERFESFV